MSDLPDDADEAFAEFLFLTETGAAPEFEEFSARFRGDASALRALYRDWLDLRDALTDGRPDSSGLDALTALRETLAERRSPRERYALQDEIARGGMGVIHRIWDRDLERHLAMKIVLSPAERGGLQRPDSASRQLERFLGEARVTGQLDHPGIVSVHDLGVDDQGRCFFTMKLVRGIDFKEVLRRHLAGDPAWPLQRALGVLLKVCDAVAYAHSKGVIHRDLKPANIMVGRFGEVYVMDWGLARVLGEPDPRDLRLRVDADASDEIRGLRGAPGAGGSPVITMDGHIVGTPSFIAPEQAQGRTEEMGPRADVYSLGATLYQLLTGTPPYVPPGEQLPAQRVLLLALQGPPRALLSLRPTVPAELAAICERAMQRDPDERYAGARELGDDLRAFLEGGQVAAFRGGALWGLRKWVARNLALASMVVLASLLAVAFASNEVIELARENRALADEGQEARAGLSVASAEREVLGEESAELVRNLRASDEVLLEELTRSAGELPPPSPASLARHEAWLRSARSLYGRLALHRSLLEELRGAGAETWQLRPLEHLIEDLADFGERQNGPLARVAARATLAAQILERSVEGVDARGAWSAAGREVAADPRYRGLVLAPQLGLVPLGADPASGLQEFAALATGRVPERDPAGELVLDARSAVVLVLVPAQEFRMGAQRDDPRAAGYDPAAEPSEAPLHEVALEAFLLAKHEFGGAQWARLGGSPLPTEELAVHPATNMSWLEATRVLRSVGLTLPSEAQWEGAARAGTRTPWWTGDEPSSLAGAAQLETPATCRVDHGRANPFGLVQILGNAAEWCADAPTSYAASAPPPPPGTRVFRGGSFRSGPANARSADRYAAAEGSHADDRGLRAARALTRAAAQ